MISPTLPNQTRFLVQTAAFIVVAFLSTPSFNWTDGTSVIVMLIITLLFMGFGWLVFRLFHRVEWQYQQGFGDKGYVRLKTIRWIFVCLITAATVWTHWKNPELAQTPLWINALLSYWSTWMVVWFVSLWVLWPVAYYKKPTDSGDYFWRNWPDSETPQAENTRPKATWRELTVLRANTLKPVFWLLIWAMLLIGLYEALASFYAWLFAVFFVAILFNGVVSALAGVAVIMFCILEAVLRRMFVLPKYLTARDETYIHNLAKRQAQTEVFIEQEVRVKRNPASNKFWLGVIAGAIGISLISGCDNE